MRGTDTKRADGNAPEQMEFPCAIHNLREYQPGALVAKPTPGRVCTSWNESETWPVNRVLRDSTRE